MLNAGKDYIVWLGPIPMIHISKPELIREAFIKTNEFKKPKVNPVFDKLFPGVVSYEGEKWAKHRKIINPAFHMEKLKVTNTLLTLDHFPLTIIAIVLLNLLWLGN